MFAATENMKNWEKHINGISHLVQQRGAHAWDDDDWGHDMLKNIHMSLVSNPFTWHISISSIVTNNR